MFIDFFYDFPVLVWPSAASYGVADNSLCSTGWSWRPELEWCERKILLDWLELKLVAVVV